ncbi:MAG TPA: hypothetical protein VM260_19570 [Pirellula sp.]|nr:hypothetical protein [Pirellula sp.]
MRTEFFRQSTVMGLLGYLGLLVAGITIVLGVLQLGNEWGMVAAASKSTPAKLSSTSNVDVVLHVLFTLVAVIFSGAVLGRLCRYVGQPPVIGEVLAGLALGPSLLGAISPDTMQLLIPSQVLDPKSSVATSLKPHGVYFHWWWVWQKRKWETLFSLSVVLLRSSC